MTPSFDPDKLPGGLPSTQVAEDVDLEAVRETAHLALNNLDSSALTRSALWKDWLSLTGKVTTFYTGEKIAGVWKQQVNSRQTSSMKTKTARVVKPVSASSWVDVPFEFATHEEGRLVGNCHGTASFIPEDGEWKIWLLVTILENFKDLGHPDVPRVVLGDITDQASDEINHEIANKISNGVSGHGEIEHQVEVVVIGAGQCGLALGGRLAALGINYLVLEKRPSVGNNWTQRYESVRQHTVREYNNLPFKRTWTSNDPLLLPGKIVAEGFENYVSKYKINLWLNANTTEATWDSKIRKWTLKVVVDEEERKLTCQHLAIAIGAGVSIDNDPKFPGTHQYRGIIQHSGAYKHSRDWACKDGIVIGTGTMAHDIAQDMYRAGLRSITMIQRSKTAIYPIRWVVKGQEGLYNEEIETADADAVALSRPTKVLRDILKTNYEAAAKLEQAHFDGLERAGFRVDRETPMMDNIFTRYGGYYIDIGASSHIINGEIKVKSGVPITTFTSEGLMFEDGAELKADVIVIATGQDHDYRNQIGNIIGKAAASKLGEFWGLDEEGEVRNVMKPAAPGLWMFGGTAAQARWWSRFMALSIQSDLLGKPLECVKLMG